MKCPYCCEEINNEAKKCKECGEFLNRSFPNNSRKQSQSYVNLLHNKAVTFSEYSQKIYFQTIYLLGIGIVLLLGSYGAYQIKGGSGLIIHLSVAGIPFMMFSWFAAFLFIYWDHHMARVYLDYIEMEAEKSLFNSFNTYLFYTDFLGVLNKAGAKACRFVWILFCTISIPGLIIGYISAKKSCEYIETNKTTIKELFGDVLGGLVIESYALCVVIVPIVLLVIHVWCVIRERRLRAKVGLPKEWLQIRPIVTATESKDTASIS